jgi:hypothetical protein
MTGAAGTSRCHIPPNIKDTPSFRSLKWYTVEQQKRTTTEIVMVNECVTSQSETLMWFCWWLTLRDRLGPLISDCELLDPSEGLSDSKRAVTEIKIKNRFTFKMLPILKLIKSLHKEGDCFFLESDVEPAPPLVLAVGV